MGRKIASNRNEDVATFVGVAPGGELPHSCLQHLIRMEPCIFAQQRTRERGTRSLTCQAARSQGFRCKKGGHQEREPPCFQSVCIGGGSTGQLHVNNARPEAKVPRLAPAPELLGKYKLVGRLTEFTGLKTPLRNPHAADP